MCIRDSAIIFDFHKSFDFEFDLSKRKKTSDTYRYAYQFGCSLDFVGNQGYIDLSFKSKNWLDFVWSQLSLGWCQQNGEVDS